MSYNKNVVEDALFQIKNLEDTLQENAKGILQSTMSEEIKQLVKESLREQDEDEIEPLTPDAEETDMEDDEMEMDDDDEMEDDEFDMDDDEMDMDDDEMDDEDDEMDDETIDMTDASDSEVLRVFKAMGDEDGIIVKKEGGNIHLKDGEDEYMINLGESELGIETNDPSYDGLAEYGDMFGDADDKMEGAIYEIEMDDEDDDFSLEDEYEIEVDDEDDDDFLMEDDEMEFKTPVRDAIRSHKGKFKTSMRDRLRSGMDDNMGDSFRSRRQREYEDDMNEDIDPEVEEMYGGNKHDFKRSNGHKMGDVDGHYKDYEMEEMTGSGSAGGYSAPLFGREMKEDMESDSVDLDTVMEDIKKTLKAKGVGIGKGPKFAYDKKPNMGGGFDQKRKEAFGKGTKAMGTGKAKFEYKQGENMEKGSMKKVETKEASRTYGNGSKDGSRGLRKARTNNRNFEYNPFKISESTNQEVQLLKDKNEEYKKALDIFRTKLNEVAVFNSNLAYATRLFTEHSTTKQEKINVLRRFDNVESLKESKSLYRSIKSELNSGGSSSEQKITESIERTVNRSVESGSAANLIESKTYENPQFLRMKDLMSKL